MMEQNKTGSTITYHFTALLAVVIWGSTYISTKILLKTFHPIEISLFRFIIGYIFLLIIRPGFDFKISFKKDKYFILSGFLGMFLYYFVENLATKYTYASNVSLIVSCIPILTSILAHIINKDERFKRKLIIGFVLSLSGIILVILSKGKLLGLSFGGDLLALAAAVAFSFYNVVIRRINKNIHILDIVRKSIFYGLIFMFITYLINPEKNNPLLVFQVPEIFHLCFLGILASGLCFIMWNNSVKEIGSIKASQYIYLCPIVTGVLSVIILNEPFGILKITGMAIIILGVFISQK
jgi:drug/metabolite transporter (DMT)-like permease